MILLAIDGSSLAFRGYFALLKHPLINSKGENVSGVYTFLNSILRLIRIFKPTHLAVAFDHPKPTFRHIAFEKYKITRPKAPPEIKHQIQRIKEAVEYFNFKIIEIPGFEADDILAKLVEEAKKNDFERIYLITSDKDILQLVENNKVLVVDTRPAEDVIYTPEKVKEKFGLEPYQISDYLALVGDKIDNIPGVPGIGEKTAKELLSKFGTIENIYKNINKIKSLTLKKLLKQFEKQAFLSKELTKLRTDFEIPFSIEDLEIKEPNYPLLIKFLSELEFPSIISQIAKTPPKIEFKNIEKFEEIKKILKNKTRITVMLPDIIVIDGKFYRIKNKEIFEKILKIEQIEKWTFSTKELYKKLFEKG